MGHEETHFAFDRSGNELVIPDPVLRRKLEKARKRKERQLARRKKKQSPMYPADKPIKGNVLMGGVPRGDRE